MIQLAKTQPRARKAHRCANCSARIHPGETYSRQTNVYDGRIYDWVSCDPCEAIFQTIWDWAGRPDEGICSDTFFDWALDHRGESADARAYLSRVNWSES